MKTNRVSKFYSFEFILNMSSQLHTTFFKNSLWTFREITDDLKPKDPSCNHLKTVLIDHNYAFPSQANLSKRLEMMFHDNAALSRKLRASQKRLSKKNQKLFKMKDVIFKLKADGVVSHEDAGHIKAMITPTLDQLFDRLRNSNSKARINYPEV